MDELTNDFVVETREMLEAVGGALLAWEADPAEVGPVAEIFRFVHTVRGSCGFLNLGRIGALADAAETALHAVRGGDRIADRPLVGAIIGIVDRIEQLVAALEPGSLFELPPLDSDADLVAAIDRAPTVQVEVARPTPVRSVRVGVPLLETIMSEVSELVLVRNELSRAMRDAPENDAVRASFARLTGIVGDLRESVTKTRMQPIERLFASLPRLVRDVAGQLGKSVILELVGHDVEIDREMVEAIRDPLIHIVRNSIDHGIEMPEDRTAAGKPVEGQLRVAAMQSGNQVSIEVSDDGRGIDPATVLRKAIQAGLIDATRAGLLDAQGVAELIFTPGLSTAEQVTSISGRGVGMDVVRANVERLGGSVTLVNQPGKGLTIALRAPLTLSIVTAVILAADEQSFALPRSAIDEIISLKSGKVRLDRFGGGLLCTVRDETMPAFLLSDMLGLAMGDPRFAVILTTAANQRYVLAVDGVGNSEELVVRPMAPQLAVAGPFAGQSLGDSGLPILLLDPVALAARAGLARHAVRPVPVAAPKLAMSRMLAATTLDGRRVGIRAPLVERLLSVAKPDWTLVDGQWFAYVEGNFLAARLFGNLPVDGEVTCAMLYDGTRRVVLPLADIEDLMPIPPGKEIGGATTDALIQIDGKPVLLLNASSLFEGVAVDVATARPVAVFAIEPTPWATSLLAPLVEAAGYEVRFEPCETARAVIQLEGETSQVEGATVVALERTADGRVAVERYDRMRLDTVLAPLSAGAQR